MSAPRKRLLFVLQTISAVMLLFMIIDIVPSFTVRKNTHEAVIYLDNTFSMQRNYSKDTLLRDIARWQHDSGPVKTRRILADIFLDDKASPVFKNAGSPTALFTHAAAAKSAQVIIISDGEHMQIPAHLAGLSNIVAIRPVPAANYAITAVIPRTLIAGTVTELRYLVTRRAVSNMLQIAVTANGNTIAQRTVPPGTGTVAVNVPYRPDRAGTAVLKASIVRSGNDTSDVDNERIDIVSVEKEKTGVVVVTGAPTKDTGILRDFFTRDSSVSLAMVDPAQGNIRIENPDVVFLINPTGPALDAVKEYLPGARRAVPLVCVYSTYSDAPEAYRYLVPRVQRETGTYALAPAEDDDDITRLTATYDGTRSVWRSVTFLDTLFLPERSDAHVLLTANNRPAITARLVSGVPVIYVYIGPLWRLKLYGSTMDLDRYYDVLIANMVRALGASSEDKALAADTYTLAVGDTARLTLRVPDGGGTLRVHESGMPLTNETALEDVSVKAVRGSVSVMKLGAGRQSVPLNASDAGLFTVDLQSAGNTSAITIAVNPSYDEIITADDGRERMQAIAKNSGKYHESFDQGIWRDIMRKTSIQEQQVSFHLWRNPYYIVLLLVLLTITWFMKRRFGLS
ncbi:MAG: hypothetical protein HZC28_11630 [Spirochaetes bacterium]|nr:hypothetical protein [Spirochaetota bacterium]